MNSDGSAGSGIVSAHALGDHFVHHWHTWSTSSWGFTGRGIYIRFESQYSHTIQIDQMGMYNLMSESISQESFEISSNLQTPGFKLDYSKSRTYGLASNNWYLQKQTATGWDQSASQGAVPDNVWTYVSGATKSNMGDGIYRFHAVIASSYGNTLDTNSNSFLYNQEVPQVAVDPEWLSRYLVPPTDPMNMPNIDDPEYRYNYKNTLIPFSISNQYWSNGFNPPTSKIDIQKISVSIPTGINTITLEQSFSYDANYNLVTPFSLGSWIIYDENIGGFSNWYLDLRSYNIGDSSRIDFSVQDWGGNIGTYSLQSLKHDEELLRQTEIYFYDYITYQQLLPIQKQVYTSDSTFQLKTTFMMNNLDFGIKASFDDIDMRSLYMTPATSLLPAELEPLLITRNEMFAPDPLVKMTPIGTSSLIVSDYISEIWPINPLSSGAHTLAVQVTDWADNIGSNLLLNWEYDISSPLLSVGFGMPTSTFKNAPQIPVFAKDQSLTSVWYQIHSYAGGVKGTLLEEGHVGSTFTYPRDYSGLIEYSRTITPLNWNAWADGDYIITVEATDLFNPSTIKTFVCTKDATGAYLTSVIFNGQPWGLTPPREVIYSTEILDIKATFSESISGVIAYTNPSSPTSLTYNSGLSVWECPLSLIALSEGVYQLTIQSTDLSANTLNEVFSLVYDNTHPLLSAPSSTFYFNAPGEIAISASESNKHSLSFTFNGFTSGNLWESNPSTSDVLLDLNAYWPASDGTYPLSITAIDKAGLSTNLNLNVIVDKILPVFDIMIDSSGSTPFAALDFINGSISIWAVITDTSPCDLFINDIYLGQFTQGMSGEIILPDAVFFNVPVGDWEVVYLLKDAAGNQRTRLYSLVFDNITPIFSINSEKIIMGIYSSVIEIGISEPYIGGGIMTLSQEMGSSAVFPISLADITNKKIPIPAAVYSQFENGTIVAELLIYDRAFNSHSVGFFIFKDTIAPIVTVLAPRDFSQYTISPPVYFLEIEEPNLDKIWYSIDGINEIVYISNNELSGAINQQLWDKIEHSQVTIRFFVQDKGGNIAETTVQVYRTDVTEGFVRTPDIDIANLFLFMPWQIMTFIGITFTISLMLRIRQVRKGKEEVLR
jgi:hypothetical protein